MSGLEKGAHLLYLLFVIGLASLFIYGFVGGITFLVAGIVLAVPLWGVVLWVMVIHPPKPVKRD